MTLIKILLIIVIPTALVSACLLLMQLGMSFIEMKSMVDFNIVNWTPKEREYLLCIWILFNFALVLPILNCEELIKSSVIKGDGNEDNL